MHMLAFRLGQRVCAQTCRCAVDGRQLQSFVIDADCEAQRVHEGIECEAFRL
jgi:hypothetical protein